jgi:putative phage-type endonuclease
MNIEDLTIISDGEDEPQNELFTSDTESISSDTESEFIAPFFVRISDEWLYEMEIQVKECIREYIQDRMLHFSSPTFYTTIVQDVAILLLDEWKLIDICDDDDYDDIVDFVEQLHTEMMNAGVYGVPLRQEPTTENTSIAEGDVSQKLERIQSIPQSKQRTTEWYETRHNLLTASNLWKVFGTQTQYNSLIYEKCLPIETVRSEKKQMSMDSNNPMQMGVKYEPISIMMYEKMYGTKITDVGCIPHAQYPYIGASPDGINMTPGYPRYGRMIEVKNIVNREITGVPLEHYWIQMQLQMEACDLDECDFIETRFKEIDETDHTIEVVKTETPSDQTNPMGCILYFLPRIFIGACISDNNVSPEYVYMPLELDPYSNEAVEWIQQERTARPQHVLYKKTYWILDQFSCVLVRRNREWFRCAEPKITEIWNTILKERETGYEHRATKKKKLQNEVEVVCSENTTTHYIKNMPISANICLVKLDADESARSIYLN